MFTANGALSGWTKSSYAAAQAGGLLTDKAIALEKAVSTGAMSAIQAQRAFSSYQSELKRGVWSAMSFSEKMGIVNEKVRVGVTELGKFSMVAAGFGVAGKVAYDFAKAGAQIQWTGEKFDRLAVAAGSTGDVFLRDLRIATKGTVSDFGLLQQGADLLQLGLAKDTQEATRLSRVMTALGMDTGELTLALANQSKRRLDQLGLSLSKFNEIEGKLKDAGLSKEDSFKEAFLQTAEQTVATTGNKANSSIGNYMRLEAAASNVWDSFKKNASGSSLVGDTANVLKGMNAVQRGDMVWNGNILDVMFGNGAPLRKTRADDVSGDLWRPQATNIYQAPQVGQSALQSYTAMAYAASKGAFKTPGSAVGVAAGAQVTEEPVDYAAMLGGSAQMMDITQSYTDARAQLNEQLSQESATLDELSRKYKRGGAEYMEQADKVDALRNGLSTLDATMQATTENWALGMLKAKGATDEQQFAFARAAGMISEDAARAYEANNRLSQAYMDGRINAETYAAGVGNLQNLIRGINGLSVNAYIDVWVRQHGGVGSIAPNVSVGGSGTAGSLAYTGQGQATAWMSGQVKKKWTGGPLGNGITLVGDAPGGGLTPYTEAVINGYVVDAKTTRKMYEAGLLRDAVSRSFGGDVESPWVIQNSPPPSPTTPGDKPNLGGKPTTGSPSSTTTATMASETASAAAEASGAAVQVAAQAIAQGENIQNSMQNNTMQTVAAQHQTSDQLIEAIKEQTSLVRNLPNKNDMYSLFHSGQQTSI